MTPQSAWPTDWNHRHSTQILVIGDVMVDHYLKGYSSRISPEAPVPVVEFESESWTPGGAALVAANAASMGAHVTLAGFVGQDSWAEVLTDSLVTYNVQTCFHTLPQAPTIRKQRILSDRQQLARIDFERTDAVQPIDRKTLLTQLEGLDLPWNMILLSDYNKGCLDRDLVSSLQSRWQATVLVDPKPINIHRFTGCTLISPNLAEARAITGLEANPEQLTRTLAQQLSAHQAVVTLGADGIAYWNDDTGEFGHYAVPDHHRVYDVTGAGDVAFAALGSTLAKGYPLSTSAQIANDLASWSVGQVGTVVVPPPHADK